MNTLQQQFDLISNDLARYGHINAAMESGNAVDLNNLRGEYTDIYHRYVTCQPHLFKRKALSVGTEGALAVAGAALLLGILVKIGAWIADFFFGGSSKGGGGGSGGGGRVAAIQTDLRTDKSIKAIKAVRAILDKGEHAKPTEAWLKKVPYKHVLVMSGKELDRYVAFAKAVQECRRNIGVYHRTGREFAKLYAAAHKNDSIVLEGHEATVAFEAAIAKHEESWGNVADMVDDLKRLANEGNVPDISHLSLKQIAHNVEQFVTKLMTTTNVDAIANVASLQEEIKLCEEGVEQVSKRDNVSKNDDVYIKITNKETVALRRELKCMQMLTLIIGGDVPYSIKDLCSSTDDYKDIFSDSDRAELAAIAETLSDKQDK